MSEFKCKKCGRCCKAGLTVLFTEKNCERIAKAYDDIELGDFMWLNGPGGDCVVNEKHLNGDYFQPCHFLDKQNRCKIYEHRPKDCRAYDCAKDPELRGAKFWEL
jgi:Fe-S-cluster containining protein